VRVVFIGASSFGLRCLAAIHRLSDVSVVGVLTNPKIFSISYSDKPVTNVLHADLLTWAAQHALPCHEMVRSMRDEALIDWVRSLEPQLFVVVGWYHMVPQTLRNIAPAIGLHASLLPDYSGGAPLVWAMINGENRTGITLFQMDEGVDSGPIIGQAEEYILATDTIGSLYARIEERGLELLERHLPALAAGTAELRRQDESARRVFPQRSPKDGWIDWNQDAKAIDLFIRSQTRPYPGAFTSLDDGRRLTIWSASPLEENDGHAPSSVKQVDNSVRVQCAQGSLLLQEVGCESRVYGSEQLVNVLRGTARLGVVRPQEPASSNRETEI
jgi:methionyl-tRNA formyltransferase